MMTEGKLKRRGGREGEGGGGEWRRGERRWEKVREAGDEVEMTRSEEWRSLEMIKLVS